jgi:hypothetical protein
LKVLSIFGQIFKNLKLKKMKKLFALLLVSGVMLSFTSCGPKKEEAATEETTTEETTTEEATEAPAATDTAAAPMDTTATAPADSAK